MKSETTPTDKETGINVGEKPSLTFIYRTSPEDKEKLRKMFPDFFSHESPKSLAQRFMADAPAPRRLCASLLLKDGFLDLLRAYVQACGFPAETADGLQELAKEFEERYR